MFPLKFKGSPVVLQGVPVFPFGRAEVFIKPKKYRYKSIFVNVLNGTPNVIDEDFFLDPAYTRPSLIDFQDIAAKPYGAELNRILQAPGVNQNVWNKLNKRLRASIFNLHAKMHREALKNGQAVISQVTRTDQSWLKPKQPERIYAEVAGNLLTALRDYPAKFNSVSGAMRHFPAGWIPAGQDGSF